METPSSTSGKMPPFRASTPFEIYIAGCAMGFASGTLVGAYVGGMIGFTIPAVAPLALTYSILKVGRTLIRK